MSDYRVYAKKSPKKLKQRFYVVITASNGETLFTSEMLKDKDYAVTLGQRMSAALNGAFVNGT